MHNKNGPQRLLSAVQIIRIRVATAEPKLKQLREQSRRARRRHKEAKRLAQRARKQFKRFKADLAELKRTLALSEVKLFQAGGRALARKMAKSRPVANYRPSLLKQSRTVARPRRPILSRESLAPGRVTRKKPAITEARVVSDGPADVAALDPTPTTPQIPVPNS